MGHLHPHPPPRTRGRPVAAVARHRRHRADLAGALVGRQRRHLPAAAAAVRLGPVIGARLGLSTS